MWETIGKILKETPERILIPTITAVATAIIVVLALPVEHWAIVKIGPVFCSVLAFCLAFLVIEFLMLLGRKIKKAMVKIKDKRELKQEAKEKEKETLEKMWKEVDSLSPADKTLLKQFIENGNEPVELSGTVFWGSNNLLNSNWIDMTEVETNIEDAYRVTGGVPFPFYPGLGKRKYKLKDDVYSFFVYSREKYGKISHFE